MGDLGDRTGRETVDDLGRQSPSLGGAGLVLDLPQLLSALPGEEHLHVSFVGVGRGREPGLLSVGEPLFTAAQQVSAAVERVALAASMPTDGLLDAAADLVDGLPAELHYMKRVEHRDGVGELVVDGVLVAVKRIQGGDLNPFPGRNTARRPTPRCGGRYSPRSPRTPGSPPQPAVTRQSPSTRHRPPQRH